MEEKQEIPEEIDDHLKLFGKEPWEIEYGDKCPLCKFPIVGINECIFILEFINFSTELKIIIFYLIALT